MLRSLIVVCVAFGVSIAAVCQTTEPPCSGMGNAAAQSPVIMRTGVGTPYTLTATIKSEKKLFDGNILSGFTTSRQARDSAGRTRVDQPTFCSVDKALEPHWDGSITVNDPVAKTYTLWYEAFISPRRAATVTHSLTFRVFDPPTAQEEYQKAQMLSKATDYADPVAAKRNIRFAAEDLGKRNIAGLEASGMRITTTAPVGVYGNSLPLITVEEKWVSDAYRVILLDIVDDPINGKSTYEVTHFTRGEPDASLFQPPADYVVTERNLNE